MAETGEVMTNGETDHVGNTEPEQNATLQSNGNHTEEDVDPDPLSLAVATGEAITGELDLPQKRTMDDRDELPTESLKEDIRSQVGPSILGNEERRVPSSEGEGNRISSSAVSHHTSAVESNTSENMSSDSVEQPGSRATGSNLNTDQDKDNGTTHMVLPQNGPHSHIQPSSVQEMTASTTRSGDGGEDDLQHQEDDSQTASASASTAAASNKKISAKELIQHVKNQKKKIQEKEAEVASLQADHRLLRMRGLATIIDLLSKAQVDKMKLRAFHKWLAFAERESAAVEVERVAGLAHRANFECEQVKLQLDSLNKEKAELELAQKKLKILLGKARQQMADQAKANEQAPEGFTIADVLRKTRGPDGTIWCLISVNKKEAPAASKPSAASSATGGPPAPATSTNQYEWREEATVCSWFTAMVQSDKPLLEKPTIEDELQERYTRATQELEASVADKQLELETLNDRFEQYRRRAELALEKAESNTHDHDAELENTLKEELARVSRDRDNVAARLEELRSKMDATESSLAAIRLREKSLREERDDLERRVSEANRAVDVARQTWEASLAKAEMENESRLRSERNELKAAQARADQMEQQLNQALAREAQLKESERLAQEKLSRADDRIEGLRAAVARAEAKATSAELSSKQAALSLASSSTVTQPQPTMKDVTSYHHAARAPLSVASSPRYQVKQPSLDTAALMLEGDSVSVAGDVVRPRRDSDESEMSNSFAAGTGTEFGSKYFVDQIGAIRAAHRNERAEWQRERAAIRSQIDDAVKRRELAEEKIQTLEKRISDMNLAQERQKQLAESARTVNETPDGLMYLKNAVFRFITADDDSERETLLPVITMLLKFSPEEVKVLSGETVRTDANSSGLLGSLLSRWKN